MRWSSEVSAGLKMHAHYMIAEPSSLLVMMASLYIARLKRIKQYLSIHMQDIDGNKTN